ncbi:MAG TPA: hypothetical protein VNG33_14180, partial [Polyangiaceae bacterium]|nr:hypothetical protein [Polyangiaceae bacterium]
MKLDWLGDYAMFGVADRAELLAASRIARSTREIPIERPASVEELGRVDTPRSEIDALAGLPVYAVVGLHSRVATAVALTAVRQLLDGVA